MPMQSDTLQRGIMVSELIMRTQVRCPASEAGPRLTAFFDERADVDRVARLPLTIDVRRYGPFEGVWPEKDAIVTVAPLQDPGAAFPSYGVAWSSATAGLSPTFVGRLEVEADDEYNAFFLRLSGDYEPPIGIAGVVSNPAAARSIARSALGELLASIAGHIEGRYRRAERAKIAARAPVRNL